jgi:hypothetical protein
MAKSYDRLPAEQDFAVNLQEWTRIQSSGSFVREVSVGSPLNFDEINSAYRRSYRRWFF